MEKSIQDKIDLLRRRCDNRKERIILERERIDDWLTQIQELQDKVNEAMKELQNLRILRARDLGAIETLEEL